MEEALKSRLRAAPAIVAIAGKYKSRPAIDFMERRSDARSAFPACIIQVISPGKAYDQDGPVGLQRRRVRFETFGLRYGSAKKLARAIIAELEHAAIVGDTRFHRGILAYERDMSPEDLGGNLTVYRTIFDCFLPTTPK